jgi:hypothetical protein
MAKPRKMKAALKMRQEQWEQIPAAKKRGTKKPGSVKWKSKPSGKHI